MPPQNPLAQNQMWQGIERSSKEKMRSRKSALPSVPNATAMLSLTKLAEQSPLTPPDPRLRRPSVKGHPVSTKSQ